MSWFVPPSIPANVNNYPVIVSFNATFQEGDGCGSECLDDSGVANFSVQCVVNGETKTDNFEVHALVYDKADPKNNPDFRIFARQADSNPSCVKVKENMVPQYFRQENNNLADITLIQVQH